MDVLIVLIVSAMFNIYLACSEVVALMNLHLHLRFLLVLTLSMTTFSVMDIANAVEVFLVSLCVMRKPTDLMVEAMSSVILLSRATVNRIFASLAVVMSLMDVMRDLQVRWLTASSTSLIGPELDDRVMSSSRLGGAVARVLEVLALHIFALICPLPELSGISAQKCLGVGEGRRRRVQYLWFGV